MMAGRRAPTARGWRRWCETSRNFSVPSPSRTQGGEGNATDRAGDSEPPALPPPLREQRTDCNVALRFPMAPAFESVASLKAVARVGAPSHLVNDEADRNRNGHEDGEANGEPVLWAQARHEHLQATAPVQYASTSVGYRPARVSQSGAWQR